MPGRYARRSRPTSPPPRLRPSAARLDALTPDRALVARFAADLAPLTVTTPLGLAVSGGADSMALLLLAAAARLGGVEAFSVDHGLRPEAVDEVALVAALCGRLGVAHHALRVELVDGPDLQARARAARYAALKEAAARAGVEVMLTAHHADDQAETLLMRLARGAGVGGLAGIRPIGAIGDLVAFRPLLGWTRRELEAVCEAAGVAWATDPSNTDPRFERARVRAALATLDLDARQLANSAAALGEADEALDWMAAGMKDRLQWQKDGWTLDPRGLPAELTRRLLLRAIAALGGAPRGPDLSRAIAGAEAGAKTNLAGVQIDPLPDGRWRIAPEPPRRA